MAEPRLGGVASCDGDSIGLLGIGASWGSSGRKTWRSVVLDVLTGRDCFSWRAGVPLPSGEGTGGAERFLRWAGSEEREEPCLREDAVLASPAGVSGGQRRGEDSYGLTGYSAGVSPGHVLGGSGTMWLGGAGAGGSLRAGHG